MWPLTRFYFPFLSTPIFAKIPLIPFSSHSFRLVILPHPVTYRGNNQQWRNLPPFVFHPFLHLFLFVANPCPCPFPFIPLLSHIESFLSKSIATNRHRAASSPGQLGRGIFRTTMIPLDCNPGRILTPLIHKKQGKAKLFQRSLRFKESNYMDPNQRLCLGALFDIAATNVLDVGRRLCIIGFCRSIEMLCDVVEDTVLEHGREVVTARKASKEGLHEKLTMTVAVPLLWGVPPVSETLRLAVRSGGETQNA